MVKIIRCLTNPVTVSLWDSYFGPSQINNDISTTKSSLLTRFRTLFRRCVTCAPESTLSVRLLLPSIFIQDEAYKIHRNQSPWNGPWLHKTSWGWRQAQRRLPPLIAEWHAFPNKTIKHLRLTKRWKRVFPTQTGSLKWCKITFVSVCQFILHFNG